MTGIAWMTEMTGIARMTEMTRIQGWHPFLNKKFKDFQGHISNISRIPIRALGLHLFWFPKYDCNFNSYPEGLSVFAPFRHMRIRVQ